MIEQRQADERLAVLEEGFKRHEEGCDIRQGAILRRLDQLSEDVATYKTSLKVLISVVGAVAFFLEYFKGPILALLK